MTMTTIAVSVDEFSEIADQAWNFTMQSLIQNSQHTIPSKFTRAIQVLSRTDDFAVVGPVVICHDWNGDLIYDRWAYKYQITAYELTFLELSTDIKIIFQHRQQA